MGSRPQEGGSAGGAGDLAAAVEETHTSVLFFVGDTVYKAKKHLDLGFLDFRRREERERAVLAEVDLNRRFSPDVYLGVAHLVGPGEGDAEPVVVMRRMPAERRLSRLVAAREDVSAPLRALARQLAVVHGHVATSPEIADAASPAALRALWAGNLEVFRRMSGVLPARVVDEIESAVDAYLDGRGDLLRERQALGLIRDGHGDLQADDVFVLPDGVRVLDCLEFDDRLRHGDVLADVAFLAMDLERLGAAPVAARFLRDYAEFSAERHPLSLQHYYVAYRAGVRAKVACLRYEQGHREAAGQALLLAGLALEHLRAAKVRLVLVGGLPGVGKSTLAAALTALGENDGEDWVLLQSDVIRRELRGETARSRSDGPGEGDYSPAARDAVYAEMALRASAVLRHGHSVIVDASFVHRSHRELAERLARETSSSLVELCCVAPPSVVADRLSRRSPGAVPVPAGRQVGVLDASEADFAVHQHLAATADPWPGALEIDTSDGLTPALRAARVAVLR